MAKILVLSELYYPEQTSTGYFLTEIAEGLAQKYDVQAVVGPPTRFLKKTQAPSYDLRNKVKIFRCRGTNFDKNILLGRLANVLTQSLTIFWKALKLCNQEDCILVVTNPPLLPFLALFIKWLKRCQLVLLVHDVYPEVLAATEICQSSSIVFRLGQAANRLLYNCSDRIITLGRDMSRLALQKLEKAKMGKIYCIPNWADTNLVYPLDRENNPILQSLRITGRFIILYAGNLGRTHGIEYLAEAAKHLKDDPKFHFIVMGSGAKKRWLEEYVQQEKLQSVTILPSCERSQLNTLLNAGDIALISFIPGMAGVSVPSRMYNQMAAGKAIIAISDDWSELAEVVHEDNIGWVVSPGDITRLVEVIKLAESDRELNHAMGIKAAKVAQDKYEFSQTDKAYKALFDEILSNCP